MLGRLPLYLKAHSPGGGQRAQEGDRSGVDLVSSSERSAGQYSSYDEKQMHRERAVGGGFTCTSFKV